MLAVTQEAVSAVGAIVQNSDMPEGSGMRISRAPGPEADTGAGVELQLTVVERPEEGDRVLEGEPLFLEPEAAELLDGKTLDAEIVENQVRFSISERPDSAAEPPDVTP